MNSTENFRERKRNMTWARKWQVPSSSNNDTYTVGLSDDGSYACSCIGWTRHTPRKDCKHITLVKADESLSNYKKAAKIMSRINTPVPAGPSIRGKLGKPVEVKTQEMPDLMKRPGRLIDLPD